MIPIPYGRSYRAEMSKRIPKGVQCERCAMEFVYFLKRGAIGEGSSFLFLDNTGAQNRAEEQAAITLLEKLSKACEPIPCPECGHIQDHMIPRARQLRLRWMRKTSIYLFPLAVIFMFSGVISTGVYQSYHTTPSTAALWTVIISWVLCGCSALGAIALMVGRYLLNRNFDPNSEDVDIRIQKGRTLAIPLAELENLPDEQSALKVDSSLNSFDVI